MAGRIPIGKAFLMMTGVTALGYTLMACKFVGLSHGGHLSISEPARQPACIHPLSALPGPAQSSPAQSNPVQPFAHDLG